MQTWKVGRESYVLVLAYSGGGGKLGLCPYGLGYGGKSFASSLSQGEEIGGGHRERMRERRRVGGPWLRQLCHPIPVAAKQLATHGGRWLMACNWRHTRSVVCSPTPSICSWCVLWEPGASVSPAPSLSLCAPRVSKVRVPGSGI